MHNKAEDMVAFVKELSEKHHQEKNLLKAQIHELKEENNRLRQKHDYSVVLIKKCVIPFIQFSFTYIEEIMHEMDEESRQILRDALQSMHKSRII